MEVEITATDLYRKKVFSCPNSPAVEAEMEVLFCPDYPLVGAEKVLNEVVTGFYCIPTI